MNKTYTAISFGNYETKILICNNINGTLYPIYKTSFLTSDCLQDSIIVDEDLLIKILEKEITKIPLDISSTKIILNVPLKNLEIVSRKSHDLNISKNNTVEEIKNLMEMTFKNVSNNKYQLDKQVVYWKVNGEEVKNINEQSNLEKVSWKINAYYTSVNEIQKYHDILNHFKCFPFITTCDSLVMNKLFKNKERKFKILVNIGHLKSSIDRYENEVLVDQKSYDFGIRHLTSEISKLASCDEKKSIEILKIYKDIVSINDNLALMNYFKEKYLQYDQVTIKEINKLISTWIIQLTSLMNMYMLEKTIDILGVDEIYFYSSMNILDAWYSKIRSLLDKRAEIHSIDFDVFSITESKYSSLVASILHAIEKDNK